MSRPSTAKPGSYPDAAGVNPVGGSRERDGAYPGRSLGLSGRSGLQRQRWRWMGTEESADAKVPARYVPGRAELPGAGRQTGGLGGRGAAGRHDGPALAVRGEGCGAPLGRRRGRKRICAHRGAASVVGVGGESSPGAEVSSATALRRTAGYETRTSGGGGGGDGGRESPSYPISGGSSSTTAAIAAAISSRSSRPPSRNP